MPSINLIFGCHSHQPVVIILNDNGRSYAPTVSRLSMQLTNLRLNRRYLTLRQRIRNLVPRLPRLGKAAYKSLDTFTNAMRDLVTPRTFFENLGVRYIGPIDGHHITQLEEILTAAKDWDGPILIHALTTKGRGYDPAVSDDLRMHDFKLPPRLNDEEVVPQSYTQAFTDALVAMASADDRVVAITAAMAGPTGLLPFQERFPERFFDVGIAEQHAVTMAAGLAMGGMKPVVAVYSTFFSRAFDQANLDVGLLNLPVVFVFDRAGITGDDGPSHHGVLDMALCLAIPRMTVFAPSCAEEVPGMLATALSLTGPSAIRFPKTLPVPVDGQTGDGLQARVIKRGDGTLCVLAVGKMVATALRAIELLGDDASRVTLYDVRVLPPDPVMIDDAVSHRRVMTVEDGTRHGGAGTLMVSAVRSRAQERGVAFPTTRIMGVPRAYLEQHKPDLLLAELGLDAAGLAGAMSRLLADEPEFPRAVPEAPSPRFE